MSIDPDDIPDNWWEKDVPPLSPKEEKELAEELANKNPLYMKLFLAFTTGKYKEGSLLQAKYTSKYGLTIGEIDSIFTSPAERKFFATELSDRTDELCELAEKHRSAVKKNFQEYVNRAIDTVLGNRPSVDDLPYDGIAIHIAEEGEKKRKKPKVDRVALPILEGMAKAEIASFFQNKKGKSEQEANALADSFLDDIKADVQAIIAMEKDRGKEGRDNTRGR